MIIRKGFVSNSSSSSFCLVGVEDFRSYNNLYKAVKAKCDEKKTSIIDAPVKFYECCETVKRAGGIPVELFLRGPLKKYVVDAFVRAMKEEFGVEISEDKVNIILDNSWDKI